jgi:hypothetical protein
MEEKPLKVRNWIEKKIKKPRLESIQGGLIDM